MLSIKIVNMITDTYLKLVKDIMKFKSISTDEAFKSEVRATADYLVSIFQEKGFKVDLYEDYGNPVLLASYEKDPDLKTILVYGHYDVQPAEIEDGWSSDPFELTDRDDRLYGRGVIDNKGQFMVHVATIFDLIDSGKLNYNVKFLLEGDEETGSGDLAKFVSEYKTLLLEADALMLSDGELYKNKPTIELGFRGVVNFSVTAKTSHTDLHSGLYGGVAPNSAHEMIKVLADLRDENGEILIPGFYENLDDISDEVIKRAKTVDMDYDEYRFSSGCRAKLSLPGKTFLEQTGLYPAFEVTGFESGYTGVGYRNSIPCATKVKVNVRTAPVQNAKKMQERLFNYFENVFPDYVDVEIEGGEFADGVFLEMDRIWFPRVTEMMEECYGQNIVYKYCGGTLPILASFKELFNMPLLMVPLANCDCGMHAANENFDKKVLEPALKFSKEFFSYEY